MVDQPTVAGSDTPPSIDEIMQGAGVETAKSTDAPSPPVREWPGVIARQFVSSVEPWVRGDIQSEEAKWGQPIATSEQLQGAATGIRPPQYGGALGVGQAVASSAATPLGPLALTPAGLAGTTASEMARQEGYGPWVQAGAGAVAGMGVGGISNAAVSALSPSVAREAVPAIRGVADALAERAGVIPPVSGLDKDLAHEVGDIVQKSAADKLVTSAPARDASADAMKKLATKVAKGKGPASPVDDERTIFLKDVSDSKKTPVQSLLTALGTPEHWQGLGPDGKAALGHWFSKTVENDPEPWLGHDPAHLAQIVPERTERGIITETAAKAISDREAAATAAATPAPPPPPTHGERLAGEALRLGRSLLHGAPLAGLAGGASYLTGISPSLTHSIYPALIASGIPYAASKTIPPVLRYLGEHPGSTAANALTGAAPYQAPRLTDALGRQ